MIHCNKQQASTLPQFLANLSVSTTNGSLHPTFAGNCPQRVLLGDQEDAHVDWINEHTTEDRLCAEALKERIGFVPIEEEKDEETVDWIDKRVDEASMSLG